MKKILWVLGGLFIALLVAVVSIPLFVDVDQYRPEITAEVDKRINGTLELGKLNLSLWGAVKIRAESITLKVNGFPGELVSAREFHLEIPFISLLSGRPQVVVVLTEPKINVVKEADGRISALELMKKGAPSSAEPAPSASAASSAPAAAAEPAKVPTLLAGAKLGLRIEKGDLHYSDKQAKSDYFVKALELDARNLGLGSDMSFHLLAPLEGKTPSFSFSGPVEASGSLQPILVGTSVKSAKGELELDATKLRLDMPGKFVKPGSMTFTAKVKLEGNERETLLRQFELQFHRYRFHGNGRITLEPVTAKLDFSVDPVRLDQAGDFIPPLKAYDLKGTANLNATADLTPESVRLNGDLKVTEGSVFLKGKLKAPLEFQVQAGFSENSLVLTRASFAAPESDLQLVGNVKNFLAPRFSLSLSGKSLNLDKLLVMAEPAQPATSPAPAGKAAASPAAPAAGSQVNPLAELARSPILAKASGFLNAQISRVTVAGAPLEQLQAKAELEPGLQLKVSSASLRTFGGAVKASGNFDLKSPALGFSTQGSASGISGKEAFATYFPKFKNTLEGTVGATWSVSGALYPAAGRIASLKGSAKLAAKDGALKSVDVQSSINSAMAKIPFLKDKKPLEVDNGFKTLTADIAFTKGVIRVDPIATQPNGKGFLLKGKSTIQASLEQESFLDVYDPQGLLPRDIEQPGKPAISLRLYGPLTAPKTDYEYTVKKLATNAGKNTLKNVAGKALDKFLGKQPEGEKNPLKDAAEKLRKKFKF